MAETPKIINFDEETNIDVEEIFDILDVDGVGYLQFEELDRCLSMLNIKVSQEIIDEIFNELPDDEQDKISKETLMKLIKDGENSGNEEEALLEAFERFDEGKRGIITREQLELILSNFGLRSSPKETKELMKLILAKDDALHYHKFVKDLKDLGLLKGENS